LLPEVREQVSDLFLAPRDDLSRSGLVDRLGHLTEHGLHLFPHLGDELVTRQRR
jgi:hypothetical protein